jgi:hypothetical protein
LEISRLPSEYDRNRWGAEIRPIATWTPVAGWLSASAQEHYLYEVANVLRWKHLNLNIGIGEGLTDGSNRFVAKRIVGLEI